MHGMDVPGRMDSPRVQSHDVEIAFFRTPFIVALAVVFVVMVRLFHDLLRGFARPGGFLHSCSRRRRCRGRRLEGAREIGSMFGWLAGSDWVLSRRCIFCRWLKRILLRRLECTLQDRDFVNFFRSGRCRNSKRIYRFTPFRK